MSFEVDQEATNDHEPRTQLNLNADSSPPNSDTISTESANELKSNEKESKISSAEKRHELDKDADDSLTKSDKSDSEGHEGPEESVEEDSEEDEDTDESDEGDEDGIDEDYEPALKYGLMGGSVSTLFQKDSASALAVTAKYIVSRFAIHVSIRAHQKIRH
jgi:hypothetical protein